MREPSVRTTPISIRHLAPRMLLGLLLALIATAPSLAQPATSASARTQPAPGGLNLKTIMAHPDWLGRSPERPYWADDSESVYYYRKQARPEDHETNDRDLYQTSLSGETLRQLEPWQHSEADSSNGSYDLDRSRKVFSRHGNVYVKDLATGTVRQLTKNQVNEGSALFLTDGRVAFRRDDRVIARDLVSGLEETLFDLEAAEDPLEKRAKEEEKAGYLDRQQPRLLRTIREGRARDQYEMESGRKNQELDPERADLPWYLGADTEIRQVVASPSGQFAVVTTIKKGRDRGRSDSMPLFVTESGYVEPRDVRSKVGSGDAVGERLWLLDRRSHELYEIDVDGLPGIADDPLAELRQAAEERKKKATETKGSEEAGSAVTADKEDEAFSDEASEEKEDADAKKKAKSRPVQFDRAVWSEDGARVALQAFSLDNKDRWIATIDLPAEAGESKPRLTPLHRIHDPAWINWRYRDLGWLRDHRSLWFLSEESGYSQLYVLRAAETASETPFETTPTALTEDGSVVANVTVSPDGSYFYYTANVPHPGIYEIYRVHAAGGAPEQITDLGGQNDYVLSPDGAKLLVEHSTTNHPPELYFQPVIARAPATRLTSTVSDEFQAIDWVEPRIVEVPSSHVDRPIYSRLYLPPEDSRRSVGSAGSGRRPAVMFVHGAGYLQNAHQGWSGYFREFMFHTLLVRRGYVVLDMDYRASAGYGRDWRTAIYRHMGKPEVEDLADGVDYLVEHHDVDRERIGVYGGSYGGFLTMMALFTEPDLFAAGAALRPVTDWAHYNHGYTSNILNTPEVDPEAYERSSPIEFAEGLEKPLLICTGMLDDNVFFQDSVRLVQKLIELEKEDWEIAIYPVEPHGFREPSSWLDEYRRILKLFETEVRGAATAR